MNEWIAVIIAIVGGFVVGAFAAIVVRRIFASEARPELMRRLADPLANLAFWIAVVVGLITALGIVNPDSLETLPQDAVDYLPRLIAGLIVFIVGNTAAGLAASAVSAALARASASLQRVVPGVVKAAILTMTVILAAGQIGLDTTIVNLAVAAGLFSIGLASALLVGLGGRSVSGEVAAARALRSMLNEGDFVELDEYSGRVVAVHSTAVELDTGDNTRLIPNSTVMAQSFRIIRAERPDDAD